MSGELVDHGDTKHTITISCTECSHEEEYDIRKCPAHMRRYEWIAQLIEEFDETHYCEEEE